MNRFTTVTLAAAALLAALPAFGKPEDSPLTAGYGLSFTAENLEIHQDSVFEEQRAALTFVDGPFDLAVDFSFMGGRRYPPHSPYQLGRYFYINDASMRFIRGGLELFGGYAPHHDVVETPYSLYISSMDIPALNAGFSWTHERFFYHTRWIRLNERSGIEYIGKSENYLDRGLTFKAFGLDFGNLTVGFQDSYVYLGQPFDAESFMAPLPMFLLEILLDSSGRPWSQDNNVNVLMGFFAEWNSDRLYLEGQLLVDDINASILAPFLGWAIPALNEIENLSKVAWNVGGRLQIPSGSIGFYHGGATKYTFEATYTSPANYSLYPYEYVYFPATEYEQSPGVAAPLYYPENYIGYKHGENNLAFLVDYATIIFPGFPWSANIKASLEWVVNGAKSPANPWHQYDTWYEIDKPVELLSDDVLEHLVDARFSAEKAWRGFSFSLSVMIGYGWNRLQLTELVAGEPKIYVPQSGNNGLRFSVSLGGTYKLSIL